MVSRLCSPLSVTGCPVPADTGMFPVTSDSQELSILAQGVEADAAGSAKNVSRYSMRVPHIRLRIIVAA